jgi:hypothetical protein
LTPVHTLEQARHRRYRHDALLRRRPDEAAALQPLGIERQAERIAPQDLAQLPTAPSEDKDIADVGVAVEAVLYLPGKTIHAVTHVGHFQCQPDLAITLTNHHEGARLYL